MANWIYSVKIKHLFTDDEDQESVQKCMSSVADVLSSSPAFFGFDLKMFRKIPVGDEVFGPQEYANKLLNRLYDFADHRRIWIE